MSETPRSRFAYFAFPLFIALILVLVYVFRADLGRLFRDRDAIRLWIKERGAFGRIAFVGLQMLQVILFVIPGEVVQLAGGYTFGFWESVVLSLAGITLGSIFNFGMGRVLGRPFVESVFKSDKLATIEGVTNSGRGAAGFFLLFVIPGIPKDALCYVAGMSRLSIPLFLGISMLGRLPGIMGSSYIGSAAYRERYGSALVVLALASVLFFVGLVFKEKFSGILARVLHRHEPGTSAEAGDEKDSKKG